MAGLVLNWTFGFQIKFSAKLKVSDSKSATSPSCETLCVTLKTRRLKIKILIAYLAINQNIINKIGK